LRDLKPKLEQFAVDARRAPKRRGLSMLIRRINARSLPRSAAGLPKIATSGANSESQSGASG